MVLDEPKESDDVFKVNGFTMVIDKDLLERTKSVAVDYVTYAMGSGFKVTPEVAVSGGGSGGGCGSGCSC